MISTTKASQILGIKPSNFRRDAGPHLIAVPVEGNAFGYFRSQVEALAAERAQR